VNVVTFRSSNCTRIRNMLDAFLDGELDRPSADEVAAHLEACPECAADRDGRAMLRAALRRATRGDAGAAALRASIAAGIRRNADVRRTIRRRVLAAAAAVVLVAGGAVVTMRSRGGRPSQPVAGAFGPAERDAAILRIGLGDHRHCALERELADAPPPAERMRAALGPVYAALGPVVDERIPPGFRLVDAHTCTYQSRRFVHVILRSDETILSLVITRKDGESFDPAGLAGVVDASGTPLYRDTVDGLEVAAIETRDHLAFVVSGLPSDRAIGVASALMPSVRDYLAALEA
jgi:anti-sigma factor (TIGR02949 family)